MWSFQTQHETAQSMAQDQDASHLVQFKKNINLGNKKLEVEMGMPQLKEERTYATLTSTNAYPLPERFKDLDELYVTHASGRRCYADREYSEAAWKRFMIQNSSSSDYLTNVFVRPGILKFEIYPTFATADLTMTMIYNAISKDLSADDYTTGTITELANLGTVVTFSGETLTTSMAGRWLKTDDSEWYKIASVDVDDSQVTLLHPYQGTTITGGSSSFTIAEIPRIPAGTHDIPVYFALWQHFLGVKRDAKQAMYYKGLWDEGKKNAKADYGNLYSSGVIPSQRRKIMMGVKDPNNHPDLSSLA